MPVNVLQIKKKKPETSKIYRHCWRCNKRETAGLRCQDPWIPTSRPQVLPVTGLGKPLLLRELLQGVLILGGGIHVAPCPVWVVLLLGLQCTTERHLQGPRRWSAKSSCPDSVRGDFTDTLSSGPYPFSATGFPDRGSIQFRGLILVRTLWLTISNIFSCAYWPLM